MTQTMIQNKCVSCGTPMTMTGMLTFYRVSFEYGMIRVPRALDDGPGPEDVDTDVVASLGPYVVCQNCASGLSVETLHQRLTRLPGETTRGLPGKRHDEKI